jgi:hypothetical protein
MDFLFTPANLVQRSFKSLCSQHPQPAPLATHIQLFSAWKSQPHAMKAEMIAFCFSYFLLSGLQGVGG